MYSDKYDYFVKEDGFLDFDTIVPLKFVAKSPLDGHVKTLFDLRDEFILEIPKEQTMPEDLREFVNLSPIPEFKRPDDDLREYKNLSPIPKFKPGTRFDTEFSGEEFSFENKDRTAIR